MLNKLLHRPVRALLSSAAVAAALTVGLLAPGAAADMRLAYQVAVHDGVGRIVSQGEADFDDRTSVGDTLGEGLRYALTVSPCDADAGVSCPEGGSYAVLSVWEYDNGEMETATVRGIVVSPAGETRFDTTLGDGGVLSVAFLPL
ncbi:hypothetical protein [Maricaulis maris]|uniref:hypothetical protein n=1 Tax=Maricaulis maris TaxID=74318 RepID=UPI003B8AD4CC